MKTEKFDYPKKVNLSHCVITNWAEFKLWITGSESQRLYWRTFIEGRESIKGRSVWTPRLREAEVVKMMQQCLGS